MAVTFSTCFHVSTNFEMKKKGPKQKRVVISNQLVICLSSVSIVYFPHARIQAQDDCLVVDEMDILYCNF